MLVPRSSATILELEFDHTPMAGCPLEDWMAGFVAEASRILSVKMVFFSSEEVVKVDEPNLKSGDLRIQD